MGKNAVAFNTNIGKEYGKPDIERLGIFVESPYMNGKGYVSPFGKPTREKGLNMLTCGRKTKSGTQHGYFDKDYKRLFEGEGKGCMKGIKTYKPDPKRISQMPFNIAGETKIHSTPGDTYGTFSGRVDAFSNARYPKPKYKSSGLNFTTRNGRKGGCGFADICLNKYPQHNPDPYGAKLKVKEYGKIIGGPLVTAHFSEPYFDKNPFKDSKGNIGPMYVHKKDKYNYGPKKEGVFMPTGPAKWKGGCQGGTFHKFPQFMPCKYVTSAEANKPTIKPGGPVFYPQSTALKSMFTSSVLNRTTDLRVTTQNYRTYNPSYTTHLID